MFAVQASKALILVSTGYEESVVGEIGMGN